MCVWVVAGWGMGKGFLIASGGMSIHVYIGDYFITASRASVHICRSFNLNDHAL